MTVENPTKAKGNFLCPMKRWSDPIGQAMTASGHAWQLSTGAGQNFRNDNTYELANTSDASWTRVRLLTAGLCLSAVGLCVMP